MKTEEKIKVMQAFIDGKQVQCKLKSGFGWQDVVTDRISPEPIWAWEKYDYRVKSEVTPRPYHNYTEMIADYCKRFNVAYATYEMPLIWVKQKETGTVRFLENFNKNTEVEKLKRMFVACTYLDGSPVGKLVEK